MTLSLNAIYNLKAVLMETGIKPDVLRAWERRYGLPLPQRTPGGHRLYSEHDIEIIKWLLARQHDGLSISHAVDMWNEKKVAGQDPINHSSQNETPALTMAPVHPLVIPDSGSSLTAVEELRNSWLMACLGFDEAAAEQVLNQAFALYPIEYVCSAVLQRGVAEIGSMWYENRASVQQEHFASALALRRLDALMMAAPPPTRAQNVIVGCPADEWHTFTPLLLALLIRRRGYNVIYLGANVPASHLIETVAAVNASLVILAAQQLNTAASLQQAVKLIAQHGLQVSFGGRIFSVNPGLVERIPGHYLGGRLEDAMDVIESLLLAPRIVYKEIPFTSEYDQALKSFVSHRAFIESILDRKLGEQAAGTDMFKNAHKYLGDNIVSALTLGDIAYVDSEIDWLKALTLSLKLPASVLQIYLQVYSAVVHQHLGSRALPLTLWFEKQLNLLEAEKSAQG